MRYLLPLLLLVSLSFPKVIIESNYPLRNNNFHRVARDENLFLILWALQKLKDVKDIKIRSEGRDTILYVERYPILREVVVEGNWFVGDEEIKNLILAKEGEPLVDFDPAEAERVLRLFYRSRGFLDAEVKVELRVDEEGFAYLKVDVKEGDLYFLGGAVFRGARSYDHARLITEAGLRLGEVYSEDRAREGSFRLQDFYRREGFLESLVYYEETRKVKGGGPFPYVLFPGMEGSKRSLIEGVLSLIRGGSNLVSRPIATLKTLFGRGSLAIPVYLVNEGRRFRIEFEGNESFSESELRELVDTDTPGVDIFFLEKTRTRIEEFYRSRGFFDVSVEYSFGEGSVRFYVKEGERYRLVPVGFKGLKLPEFYDREAIEEAKEVFLEGVRRRGYITAQVRLKEGVDREGKKVYLLVEFYPGKRVLLKEVRYIGGDRKLGRIFEKYNALLPRILEERFLEDLHREVRRYLEREGYLDGDFSVDVRVEREEDSLLLSYYYRVEKGERYRYGELLIYGNEKTHWREIYYTVIRQRYFSSRAEEDSLWNLIQSENFTGVRIENLVDRESKVVHRLVEVREDKRGAIELAIGYNTEERLKIEGGIKFKNLFRVGIIARLHASRSERYETYELGLSDRFLFSSRHFADISLFRRLEFRGSFDLVSTGYSLSPGYRFTRWTSLTLFYSRTRNEVSGAGAGVYNLSKVGFYLVRERRDDPVNPSEITHNSIRLTRAEGDRSYYTVEVNNFLLREVVKGVAVNGKLAFGWSGREAPIFDRFFLGGLRDMRGYAYESIGAPDGGRIYLFGRGEVLFTLVEPLWAGTYAEAGNVGNDLRGTLRELRYDLGFAFGVRTPAGFVRLDLAVPLTGVDRPLSELKVYLSIGFVY